MNSLGVLFFLSVLIMGGLVIGIVSLATGNTTLGLISLGLSGVALVSMVILWMFLIRREDR